MAITSSQVGTANTLEQFRVQFNNLQTDVSGLEAGTLSYTALSATTISVSELTVTSSLSADSFIFEGDTDDDFETTLNEFNNEHGFANSRARLRMATLYQVAAANSGIVVSTGNKVEDFGVGFYTKYGDGGVDISPIADCTKTQVWELGKYLGVSQKIIDAEPTDGLWNDGRNDTDQLGMTYAELEKAMENKDDSNYKKYLEIRKKNLHKMDPIPVCKFNES